MQPTRSTTQSAAELVARANLAQQGVTTVPAERPTRPRRVDITEMAELAGVDVDVIYRQIGVTAPLPDGFTVRIPWWYWETVESWLATTLPPTQGMASSA